MKRTLPAGSRLYLPATSDVLRELRHDLRTPINPILGYCELIVEESGAAAPAKFLAGLREVHAIGRRMLRLTNELFSDQPSPLHHLTCHEVLRAFRTPARQVEVRCARLRRQAMAAGLPVAARDLERIALATDRWRKRIEEMLIEHGR